MLKKRIPSRSASPLPQYDALEPRKLLAAFTGTAGNDVVTVTFVGAAPRFVEINGTVFDNHDATASIDLLGGTGSNKQDEIRFVGGTFDVAVDGDSPGVQGTVNGVFTMNFANKLKIVTEGGNDTFDMTGGTPQSSDPHEVTIESGAGNDLLKYRGGVVNAFLGAGDDTIEIHTGYLGDADVLDAGDGFDTMRYADGFHALVQFRGVTSGGRIFFGQSAVVTAPNSAYQIHDIEKVIANVPGTFYSNTFAPSLNSADEPYPTARGLDWVVDGAMATGTRDDVTVPLVLENFWRFRFADSLKNNTDGRISILATAFPMEIWGFGRVEIGFAGSAILGNTSQILHPVSPLANNTLVVSNYANASTGIMGVSVDEPVADTFSVSGITPAPIGFSHTFYLGIRELVLWGKNGSSNRFAIESTNFRTVLYGGRFEDVFHVGGYFKRNLDLIRGGSLNVIGRGIPDLDYLYINDQNSTGKFNYWVSEQWIDNSADYRGVASRPFKGVWYTEISKVVVSGNQQPNIFFVSPSTKVDYLINYNAAANNGFGDGLSLAGTFYPFQLLENSGTLWFGQPNTTTPKPIRFTQLNYVPRAGRIAMGSTMGSAPVVEVYRELESAPVFSFNPFPLAPNFKGGLSVASGIVANDYIPDIVVGMENYGKSHVVLFSGRDGSRKAGFVAFENYTGGINIAIGNVMGDAVNEIIVSKLTGGNDVRVFSVAYNSSNGGYTFTKALEFNPFPGAPAIGVRVAAGDVNGDGFDDVYSAAGPGWVPQVAIHAGNTASPAQLSRFLAGNSNNSQGLSIAAGNFLGGTNDDVIVGLRGSQNTSSIMRVFASELLPANQPGTILGPSYASQPFATTNRPGFAARDNGYDGYDDRLYVSTGQSGTGGEVKRFGSNFAYIDSVFAQNPLLLNGIDLG